MTRPLTARKIGDVLRGPFRSGFRHFACSWHLEKKLTERVNGGFIHQNPYSSEPETWPGNGKEWIQSVEVSPLEIVRRSANVQTRPYLLLFPGKLGRNSVLQAGLLVGRREKSR
jgi:hypothetical protein